MIHLDQCNSTLRERIERQMSVEDAAKKPVFSHTGGSGSDLNDTSGVQTPQKSKNRIRQSQKPLLNHLESEWHGELMCRLPLGTKIHQQAWRVKLASGAWFKVDFCAVVDGMWRAWEVKGPKQGKNVARGLLALKVAATQFPEVHWILVWKESGQWATQHVLP